MVNMEVMELLVSLVKINALVAHNILFNKTAHAWITVEMDFEPTQQ